MQFINSKIFSALLLIVLVWLGFSSLNLTIKDRAMRDEAMRLEGKIEMVKKENSNFEKYISYMHNPSFLEREARLRLNYKAPDEQVAFIYRDNSSKKASRSFEDELANMKNYQKWWYWLWGYK